MSRRTDEDVAAKATSVILLLFAGLLWALWQLAKSFFTILAIRARPDQPIRPMFWLLHLALLAVLTFIGAIGLALPRAAPILVALALAAVGAWVAAIVVVDQASRFRHAARVRAAGSLQSHLPPAPAVTAHARSTVPDRLRGRS